MTHDPVATAIRAATAVDAIAITSLCAEHAAYERASFDAEHHSSNLVRCMTAEAPRVWLFVAEHSQDGLIGYAAASREYSTWAAEVYLHMDCLFVRDGYRNQKIGQRLFEHVLQFAQAEGLRQMQWQTPSWNEGASRFYRAQGAASSEKIRFAIELPLPDRTAPMMAR